MKATVELTNEEYLVLSSKYKALYEAIAGHKYAELLTYQRRVGYARYAFSGSYTDKLVKLLGRHPDEDEIIMLVDSGYNHFGAYCTIDRVHKSFVGHVNTD